MKRGPEVEERSDEQVAEQQNGKTTEQQDAQVAEQPDDQLVEQPDAQPMEQQDPGSHVEAETDTYVEPEPVSRFSREEKGKGKAVDERREAHAPIKLVDEKPSLAPVIALGHHEETPDEATAVEVADQIAVKENGERPSRSYLQSPRVRPDAPETKEEVGLFSPPCGIRLSLVSVVLVADFPQLYRAAAANPS